MEMCDFLKKSHILIDGVEASISLSIRIWQ
jgi:hypothetical protein